MNLEQRGNASHLNQRQITNDLLCYSKPRPFPSGAKYLVPFLKKNLVFWEPPLNLPLLGEERNFPPLQGEGWGGVMSLIEKIFLKIQYHLIETALDSAAGVNHRAVRLSLGSDPSHAKQGQDQVEST